MRWKKWLKQFELYLKVKNIEDPDVKRTHLLYYGKDDIQKVLEQDDDNADYVSDAYQRAVRKLNSYYLQKVSRIYERSVFRKLERDVGEKIESFVLRLKKQAEFCDFGDQIDWMIVDQVVEKMKENELKKKILKGNFNLEEIQAMISANEMVQKQIKSYDTEAAPENVNAIYSQKRPQEFDCYACGKRGHRAKSFNCPAKNKQCGICKKVGHFAVKCCKKLKHNGESSNQIQLNRDERYRPRTASIIRNVTCEEDVYDNSEIVFNINAGTEVNCIVGGISLNFIIDTGSSANIIGENDWKRFASKFIIQQQLIGTDKTFKAYGSVDCLHVLGRIKMKIEIDGKQLDDWFYIIKNGQRSLLSGETAERLQLIKMKKEETFPKLRDVKAYIHIDRSVKPVIQPYRRIPIALEKRVVLKLNEMLEQDIIEYVNHPAQWISSMVIVPNYLYRHETSK